MQIIFLTFVVLAGLIVTVYLVQHPKEETPSEANSPVIGVETGRIDKVFDWSGHKCEEGDLPDAPARAFVDNEGNVQLIATHLDARREIGPNLNKTTHSCDVIFRSDHDPEPRKYNDNEWLTAFYTLDGRTIYSLIHTEYHGWEHDNCHSSDLMNCWWNSINLAVSTDGGRSYSHATPIDHNILNPPADYRPGNTRGPIGYFQPTKIVANGGYYYVFVSQHNPGYQERPPEQWGSCLMRTNNLADPKSWRIWDGSGFNLLPGQPRCKLIDIPGYDLSYNTYLGKYISIGCHWEAGCTYAVSDDLINWESKGYLLPGTPNPEVCIYSSVLQPGDPTRNFEQSGRSPWLYYTQCGSGQCSGGCGSLDRDLKRIRIRFTKPGDENRFELLDLQMNEKKGTKTLDSSFYVNDGNLSGSVSFQEGEGRNFLRFNGGKVEIPSSESLNVSTPLTITATIRTRGPYPQGSFPTLIRKEETANKRNYGFYLTEQGLLHFSSAGIGSTSETAVNDGQWHQVAVTYERTTGKVRYYIDGHLDVERDHGDNLAAGINAAPVIIGDQGFNGDIDSLTLYNYLANEGTIQGIKNLMPGCVNDSTINSQKIYLDGVEAVDSDDRPNVYVIKNVPAGTHTVSTAVPSGYSAAYTRCYNDIKCHQCGGFGEDTNVPTPGSSVQVDVPAGGFVDLWWYYYPPAISPEPTPTATPTPGPTATPTLTPTVTPTPKPTNVPTATPEPTMTPTVKPTPLPTTVLCQQSRGDIDNNGVIDIFDYSLLVVNYGKEGEPGKVAGDLDCNGKVNIFDFSILLTHYGEGR